MRTLARIISVFLGLLLIGGALLLLIVKYELVPRLAVQLPGWADQNVVLGAGAALLLIALILLIMGLRSPKKARNAIIKGSEYGQVEVSIDAIENILLRVIQQIQGIKDVSRKVVYTQDGLLITMKIRVMPDVPMPDVSSDLQSKTKEYVEQITGIAVQEVKVQVENIVTDQSAPVK